MLCGWPFSPGRLVLRLIHVVTRIHSSSVFTAEQYSGDRHSAILTSFRVPPWARKKSSLWPGKVEGQHPDLAGAGPVFQGS